MSASGAATLARNIGRTPLAELLHALNQPLTGLQCSLEVTLALPRSNQQYEKILRDGLALTERMRQLVETLREVAEIVESNIVESNIVGSNVVVELSEKDSAVRSAVEPQTLSPAEWPTLLRENVEELRPVALARQVTLASEMPEASSPLSGPVPARRSPLATAIFRVLDSVIALAASGSTVRIDAATGSTSDARQPGFQIRWRRAEEEAALALSRPELGLLAARARLVHGGAGWERERTEDDEVLTVRLPGDAAEICPRRQR